MLSALPVELNREEGEIGRLVREAVDKAVKQDPLLEHFSRHLEERQKHYYRTLAKIESLGGSFEEFTKGHLFLGFNEVDGNLTYREWSPAAEEAFLIGDFNNWNRKSHQMVKDSLGIWGITMPSQSIPEGSKVKVTFRVGERWFDRISPWISRAEYNPHTNLYDAVYIPKKPFEWKNQSPPKPKNLKIYESHVGIASPEGRVASYRISPGM